MTDATRMAALWRDVLHTDVGTDDSFFSLGFDSLRALSLLSHVNERLGVDLTLRDLFADPTPRGLATVAAERGPEGGGVAAEPRASATTARASLGQEEMWGDVNAEARASLELINGVYRIHGPLDREALRAALQDLADRHDALRTSFYVEGGHLMMRIAPSATLPLDELRAEGDDAPAREAWATEWIPRGVATGFDRSRAPLLRVTLIELDRDEHYLVLVMDHILSDGWTMGVVARELSAFYDGRLDGRRAELPPPMQYADWANRQRAALTAERRAELGEFWRAALGDAGGVAVELPGYRGPRDADSYAGETLAATIDDDLTRALRASAGRLGTTLFVVMATALVRTLSEWTGQSEIPLMTTTAERPTTESQRMLGFTANTVWVRVRADAHEPFAASAARLQDRLLAVLRHADAPTMTLLEQAFPGAFDGFPALQQVYFQVNELWHDALELRGTTNEAAEWEEPTAQPGLQLYATDRRSDIELDVHWLRGSMPRADVQRVVDAFVAELTRQASRLRETSA